MWLGGEEAFYGVGMPSGGVGELRSVTNPRYARQKFTAEMLAATYKGGKELRASLLDRFAAYNGADWIDIQDAQGKSTNQYLLLAETEAFLVFRPGATNCVILQLQRI